MRTSLNKRAPVASARSAGGASKRMFQALGFAPAVWYAAFLLAPLFFIVLVSFAQRGVYGGIEWHLSFANYTRAFDPIYAWILLRSFVLALLTSIGCLLIGLPVALTLATSRKKWRGILLFAISVPFLTNLIVRVGALKAITGFDGPLVRLLTAFGIAFDPFALSQNLTLVSYALLTTYLPFAIFPLYGALERFDFSLVEAARDLGASEMKTIFGIILPNIRKAMASAFLLVFIPALGEFVIPDLLGGAKVMLNGNLISEQFLKTRDWPFGAALSVLLILIITLFLLLARGTRDHSMPKAFAEASRND